MWLGNTWDLSFLFARRRILVLSKTKPHASFLVDVVFLTDQVPAQKGGGLRTGPSRFLRIDDRSRDDEWVHFVFHHRQLGAARLT